MSHSAAEPARLVYDSLPSALLVLGRGGHILHANAAAERLLGTGLAAMRGRRPADVWQLTAADGSALGPQEQLGLAAIESGEPDRGVLRRVGRPDGRWLDVEVDAVPALGADGHPYQAVCTLTDVTERRRIEARVRQSEREWRQLFQSAGIGMARLDLRGKVLRANAVLGELLGYAGGALEGRMLASLLLPEDASSLQLTALADSASDHLEADVRYLRRNGAPVWVHSVVSLVRDGQGRPSFLINSVEDITARKAREAELEHRVLHDLLTGLANRALLQDRLLQAIRSARRNHSQVAVVMLDVNGLKQVNDGLGHLAGDSVLVELAQRLVATVRKSDTVARVGGDEFAIVMPGVGSADAAAVAAAKVQAVVAAPLAVDGAPVRLGIGLGLAVFPGDGEDPEALLQSADLAMLSAKRRQPEVAEPAPARRRAPLSAEAVSRRADALEALTLLMSLPGEQVRRLARRTTELTVPAGTTLNDPAAPASALHVIESGSCEVLAPDQDRPLLVLGSGDLVGTSMVLGQPPGVVVRTAAECRLLEIREEVLRAVVPADSEVYDELRRVALQRRAAIARMAEQASAREQAAEARTIAVYSPKGGSGKTTLAVNLAAALAREHPDDVLLVDLALPYNHAALLARLTPTTCLARMAQEEGDAFAMLLRGGIVRHEAGFMVLSSALRPEEGDLITGDLVSRMLQVTRRLYRYVVFDLGVALTEPVLSVLERADDVVPVVTPELTSMKDAAQFLEILTGVLHLPPGSVHLAVNHRSPDSGMSRSDVERLLRTRVTVEVGYDGPRPEQAALRGEVLVLTQPRSGIARGTATLAEALDAQAARSGAEEGAASSVRSRLFGYAVN